jgi:hypothetical protein
MTDALWERGIADLSAVTVRGCRTVQTSYRLRRNSPQVAEWHYRVSQPRRRSHAARSTAEGRPDGGQSPKDGNPPAADWAAHNFAPEDRHQPPESRHIGT